MKVLVVYASRHGSTAGTAERIAARISDAGLGAEAQPVAAVRDLGPYEATVFAKRYRRELQAKRVWLFSSGPLGNDAVDPDGEDILKSRGCDAIDAWADGIVAGLKPSGGPTAGVRAGWLSHA